MDVIAVVKFSHGFVSFNYSKMANWGFWTYSNTLSHFWNLQNVQEIWTSRPIFITNIFWKIQENQNSFYNLLFSVSRHLGNPKTQHVGKCGTPAYGNIFQICWNIFPENVFRFFRKYVLERHYGLVQFFGLVSP